MKMKVLTVIESTVGPTVIERDDVLRWKKKDEKGEAGSRKQEAGESCYYFLLGYGMTDDDDDDDTSIGVQHARRRVVRIENVWFGERSSSVGRSFVVLLTHSSFWENDEEGIIDHRVYLGIDEIPRSVSSASSS
jgi:hypothetical protein